MEFNSIRHTFGVSGIKILDLIADGVTNAQTLAARVTTKIKRKDEAQKALTNCLTTEHCFVIKLLMRQFRDIQALIDDMNGWNFIKAKVG